MREDWQLAVVLQPWPEIEKRSLNSTKSPLSELIRSVIHPKAGLCVKLNSFSPAAAAVAAQSLMQFESLMRGEFSALPLSAKFTLPTKAAIRGNGIICTAAKLNTSRSTDCLLRLGTSDMQHIFLQI